MGIYLLTNKKCQALTLYPMKAASSYLHFLSSHKAECNKLTSDDTYESDVDFDADSQNVTYFAAQCFVGLLSAFSQFSCTCSCSYDYIVSMRKVI